MADKTAQIIKRGRQMQGLVISGKMDKTIVVEVTRIKVHPKYRKRYKIRKRYKAHNPENKYKIGDRVTLQECRPLSKEKRWIAIGKAESQDLRQRINPNSQNLKDQDT